MFIFKGHIALRAHSHKQTLLMKVHPSGTQSIESADVMRIKCHDEGHHIDTAED